MSGFYLVFPALLFLIPLTRFPGFIWLILAGLLFLIAALLVTLLVEVPIDRKISTWTVATAPADWKDIRKTWGTFHTLRTFAALAGTICYIFPLIFYKTSTS